MKFSLSANLAFVRLLACAAAAAIAIESFAGGEVAGRDRPLKVLAIGNSFSICTLANLPQVATNLGVRLDLCSLYIPGCTLNSHWKNVETAGEKPDFAPYIVCRATEAVDVLENTPGEGRHKRGRWSGGYSCRYANIPQMLATDRWDVVTIQQGSHESWQPKTYNPSGSNLVATIRRLAPQAKICFQQTWSYTPWDSRLAKWGLTPVEMFERIESSAAAFSAENGLEIIPTGKAIEMWRAQLPVKYADDSFGGDAVGGRWTDDRPKFTKSGDKWIPKCDVFHLNEDGEYLQALVWAAKLFGKDVTAVTYRPAGLSEEKAALMRKIAAEAASAR